MTRRRKRRRPKAQKRTTLTSRVIFIFSVVISKTIAKLSLTLMRRFGSILITPGLCRAFRSVDFHRGSHWPTHDRMAESAERCGEGRRDRARPGRSARGSGLGSLFCRMEICRRSERTKARERTFAGESDRERSAGASDRLSGASR